MELLDDKRYAIHITNKNEINQLINFCNDNHVTYSTGSQIDRYKNEYLSTLKYENGHGISFYKLNLLNQNRVETQTRWGFYEEDKSFIEISVPDFINCYKKYKYEI